MSQRSNWTREELILVFNLYLKVPFGKINARNSDIIGLSQLIGRTANSIAIRLTNFAACDPYHRNRGVKGMVGGIKVCKPIWDEFYNNKEELIYFSEQILANKEGLNVEIKYSNLLKDTHDLKGEDKVREVKTRINQSVFREIVLTNYDNKCAISGIDLPELLVASHIIPWSKSEIHRLNPENGICLSALYDRAFDKGLIGINDQYRIIISNKLKAKKKTEYYKYHFEYIENIKINIPNKYIANIEFLQFHFDSIFIK